MNIARILKELRAEKERLDRAIEALEAVEIRWLKITWPVWAFQTWTVSRVVEAMYVPSGDQEADITISWAWKV